MERFSYNVMIANLHEIYNFFNKTASSEKSKTNLLENYRKILTIMMPIVPHLSSECLKEIAPNEEHRWPTANNSFLQNKNCTIVVQINGKKRAIFTTEIGMSESAALKKIKKIEEVHNFKG